MGGVLGQGLGIALPKSGQGLRQALDEAINAAKSDGTLARIAGQIRTEKTLSFLFDKARKEAPKPEEKKPEAAEAAASEPGAGQ